MKKNKIIFISFFIIVILIISYLKLNNSNKIMVAGEEISLEKPWKEPTEKEIIVFKSLLSIYKFENCESLFLKEIDDKNYIVACLQKDKNWNFYWATPSQNNLMTLSDEIKSELTPPK